MGQGLESLRALRGGDFDRNITIQTWVPRAVNLSHATLADESEDLVGAEFVTYRNQHGSNAVKFTRLKSPLRLDDARSLSEAARRTNAEQQDEAWTGALRIES